MNHLKIQTVALAITLALAPIAVSARGPFGAQARQIKGVVLIPADPPLCQGSIDSGNFQKWEIDGVTTFGRTGNRPVWVQSETLAHYSSNAPASPLLDLPEKARAAFERYREEGKFQHAIWILSEFGRWDLAEEMAAELENLLKTLPVKKIEPWKKHGDTVGMRHVYLEGKLEALYKPAQASGHYGAGAFARREVAAYAVDQLLHTAVVPATVLRTLEGHREPGSLQVLVNGAENASRARDAIPVIRFLDSLISNTDTWSRNVLELDLYEGRRMFIAIDHNQAFFRHNAAVQPPNDEIRRRLRELNDATLDDLLGDLLTPREMTLLKQKRDAILALE